MQSCTAVQNRCTAFFVGKTDHCRCVRRITKCERNDAAQRDYAEGWERPLLLECFTGIAACISGAVHQPAETLLHREKDFVYFLTIICLRLFFLCENHQAFSDF